MFAVPLQASTAAEYAILPGLLTRSSRRYPTLTALNRCLDGLYGASVTGSNERLGGWQILRFFRVLSAAEVYPVPGGSDRALYCPAAGNAV